ncbi:universal stress protein [Floridanema evergladense]|uniref:Universal stress protein n=1 Tax=Floridaenema evergladense BLCC-F167 TaxID=3153639 RepID=A0ABV4WL24_9CYAN
MIEKILLADSGTGHTEEMLKALMEVPAIKPASVSVLHVVPPQVVADEMTAKWEEGGKFLATAIQNLQLDPTHVRGMLRQGDPKTTVCEVADEIEADLIIMGSRGLKRLESILENSVSQYVFQLSKRPMLLVKDDIYVKKINKIMVAVDGSEGAKECLKLALFLLRDIKGGQLILAHVNAKGQETPAGVESVLKTGSDEAKKLGIAYKSVTGVGKSGEEICRLAEENNVDLLMLGSPDRRPTIAKTLPDLDRLLGNSLSDYVRVHANCPVLLARTIG